MAQGKLHGSPFHVESRQYTYAIEHETVDCYEKESPNACPYFEKNSKRCRLWNSGMQHCIIKSCRFINDEQRAGKTCDSCAYCFQNECFMPLKRNMPPFSQEVAQYCSFCCGKGHASFSTIRRYCERITLTRIADACHKKIIGKEKYIRKAKAELADPRCKDSDRQYLENKIQAKAAERDIEISAFAQANARLNELGGRLTSFPTRKKK